MLGFGRGSRLLQCMLNGNELVISAFDLFSVLFSETLMRVSSKSSVDVVLGSGKALVGAVRATGVSSKNEGNSAFRPCVETATVVSI
jgi:hypothetical protein